MFDVSPFSARTRTVRAQHLLSEAAAALRGQSMMPLEPTIGIPERSGPDSPDNLWFVPPSQRFTTLQQFAHAQATEAVTLLGTALATLAPSVPAAAAHAIEHAHALALTGLSASPTDRDLAAAASRFESASRWASHAVALIDHARSGPLPAPGEPGSPITIQPIFEIERSQQLPA